MAILGLVWSSCGTGAQGPRPGAGARGPGPGVRGPGSAARGPGGPRAGPGMGSWRRPVCWGTAGPVGVGAPGPAGESSGGLRSVLPRPDLGEPGGTLGEPGGAWGRGWSPVAEGTGAFSFLLGFAIGGNVSSAEENNTRTRTDPRTITCWSDGGCLSNHRHAPPHAVSKQNCFWTPYFHPDRNVDVNRGD